LLFWLIIYQIYNFIYNISKPVNPASIPKIKPKNNLGIKLLHNCNPEIYLANFLSLFSILFALSEHCKRAKQKFKILPMNKFHKSNNLGHNTTNSLFALVSLSPVFSTKISSSILTPNFPER